MVVSIELFGILRDIAKIERVNMPITGNTRAREAMDYVQSRYPELPLGDGSFLIAVNREPVHPDTLLRHGDIVCFLPHIGGG
jgi:molybdopterin converting factor small subunit